MDWIKVKTAHAQYDFLGAKDNVFRAWIMAMIYTAGLEKLPNITQLEVLLGKQNYRDLEKHFKDMGISTEKVLKKVLEDVDVVRRHRRHSKEYMRGSRSCSNVAGNVNEIVKQVSRRSGV